MLSLANILQKADLIGQIQFELYLLLLRKMCEKREN